MAKLLIAIPIKSARLYLERAKACVDTWLKDSSVDYKFFSDAELGLDSDDEKVRPKRTQLMCKYALENGYDYIFRTDSDAYVWVNRLLACGFEKHDYSGWCVDYPKHLEINTHGLRTAHGGIGFFLSRRSMEIVVATQPWPFTDGVYWGDMWTGQVLYEAGIRCHRDTRFLDGSNGDQHHGNIFANELPEDHQYVVIHPVPAENMYEIHERFKNLSSETTLPDRQIWWNELDVSYGQKRPDICACSWCKGV